ncbi:MAG: putative Ig domain-containing protein, partial [Verrucomicrobiota bacterium]
PNATVTTGSPLSFTASVSDVTSQGATYQLAAGAPAGAVINASTGVFTWTPTRAQGPGTYQITVNASDIGITSATDSKAFTVTVVQENQAPVFAAINPILLQPGEALRLTAHATDAHLPAQTLQYTLGTGAPEGATLDPVTGVLTWTPPAGTLQQSIQLIVSDNGTPVLSATQTVVVNINTPPVVENPKWNGSALASNTVLTQPGTVSISAADPHGIAKVEFYAGNRLLGVDPNAADGFSIVWDLSTETDGDLTVRMVAFDSFGQHSELSVPVKILLGAPGAPVITSPANNATGNETTITLRGTAVPNTAILLFVDDASRGVAGRTGGDGLFAFPVAVKAGANKIEVAARFDRGAAGLHSLPINALVDLSIPGAPRNLRARAMAGGAVDLTWSKPTSGTISNYHVYRETAAFTTANESSRIGIITTEGFRDIPPNEG